MEQSIGPLLTELPAELACHRLDEKTFADDLQAVRGWLQEYAHKENTLRAYRKEAERFLLWCALVAEKSLSSLERQDFDHYVAFLANPQPRERWCGAKGGQAGKRGQGRWRPFKGPLTQNAQRTALAIIHSMMSYLVDAQYLKWNPLSLMRRRAQASGQIEEQRMRVVERILDDVEWQAMLETLELWPETTSDERAEKERLRFLVAILFLLGLRIHELESHRWNAFRKVQGHWWFFVRGKGDKLGKIPVNDALLEAAKRFREHLGKQPLPNFDDETPLIPSWRSEHALGVRQMSQLVKRLAQKTAGKFADDPERAQKLQRFSPHWLRHLSASMQDRVGISFKHIKANHRHESDETTRRYVHAIDQERHDDMQRLTL